MMDATTQNAVMSILANSALSSEDRNLWQQKLYNATDLQVSLFISLCTADPTLLELMTANLKTKISASSSRDMLIAIFDDERRLLQDVLIQ
jgi:hypothetical protein